ncbi:MAG: M23 family metallopeptidase [Bacteroidetes bacterium]|jgi:murein DD-endopeptidase MepM/ murein hydrolase activator NlpD|nr:MAG: M23 family metallopeptidase [Bacteroidota bacterium]
MRMDLKRTAFLLLFSFTVSFVFAQDSLQLSCPLKTGVPKIIRASDKDYQKSSEYGVMVSSKTDTAVQAVHDAAVVIVARTEDTKYDVVLQYKGYYFWYAGVLTPKVKQGARVKTGDIIGTYKPGDMLEMLMFLQEEPVNPRKYLKCN